MTLRADSDLSDFWTLRILLFKGLTITQAQFDAVSEKLIQNFSSIPLHAVEKDVVDCQYVKTGGFPGITAHSFSSAFQRHSLSSSTVDLSFIVDQRNACGPDEWKSLQISRQVVGVLCLDALDQNRRPHGQRHQHGDLASAQVGSDWPLSSPALQPSSRVAQPSSPRGGHGTNMEASCGDPPPTSHHRKRQHSENSIDSVLEITRDLRGKALNDFPFAKVFQVVYVRFPPVKPKKETDSDKASKATVLPTSAVSGARMLTPETWYYDSQGDDDEGSGDSSLYAWLSTPVHHFVCRLVLLIVKTIKKANSSSDADTDNQAIRSAHGPKSLLGKAKKRVSDLHLLLGQPLAALSHSRECTDLFRSSGDVLWLAASLENEAAALRLYDLRYLEADVALKTMGTTKRQATSPFKPAAGQGLPDISLPTEIENLSRDAPKRWAFALLGAPSQSETKEAHLQIELSPTKQAKAVGPTVGVAGVAASKQKDEIPGLAYSRFVPNRSILIDMIQSRLKESLQLYQNTSPFLAAECSLRYSRFLSFLGERYICLETLSSVAGEARSLNPQDHQSVLIACASICGALGFVRHVAFYLVEAALSRIDSNAVSAQRLLLLESSRYALDPFGLIDYWETLRASSLLSSSPPLLLSIMNKRGRNGSPTLLSKNVGSSLSRLSEASIPSGGSPKRKVARSPSGFNLPMLALRSLARDLATSGGWTPSEWNLRAMTDPCHFADFSLSCYRLTYCQSSVDFFQKHLHSLLLSGEHRQSTALIVWPTLQILILEYLHRASNGCKDYKVSLFICFVTLSLLHSMMDAQMQSEMLERISATAAKLSSSWSTPPALTVIPAITTDQVKTRPLRRSLGFPSRSRQLNTLTTMGGVGRGFCHPIPNLISLELVHPNIPTMSQTHPNNIAEAKRNVRLATVSTDGVFYCQERTIDFIRCRNGATKSTSSDEPTKGGNNDKPSAAKYLESPIFLFSPFRDKADTDFQKTQTALQQPRYWVVNELQTVRVHLEHPLVVDVVLDQAQILMAGGSVECHPATVLIPSAVVADGDASSVTLSRVSCDFNLVPKESCQLHFLGLRYTIADIDSSHLILRNTSSLKLYFEDAVRGGVDGQSEGKESSVLKNSSIASIDVIDHMPQLIGTLQKVRASSLHHTTTPLICQTTSVTIGASDTLSLGAVRCPQAGSDEEIYMDLEHSPALSHGESCLLALCLSNASSTAAAFIEVVLLYAVGNTFDDWLQCVTSMTEPELFFVYAAREKVQTQTVVYNDPHPAAARRDSGASSDVPFSFPHCPATIITSGTSAAPSRVIEPAFRTSRYLSFDDVRLAGGETFKIAMQCRGTKGLTECAAVVRYYSSSLALHERYLIVPVRLHLSPIPPVCLNTQEMDVLPFRPFDDSQVAPCLLLTSNSHYSTDLKRRLRLLYSVPTGAEEAHTASPVAMTSHHREAAAGGLKFLEEPLKGQRGFDHPMALLSLHVQNGTSYPVECYSTEDSSRIPTIRMQPHSTVRWMIPVHRGGEDEQLCRRGGEQISSAHQSRTAEAFTVTFQPSTRNLSPKCPSAIHSILRRLVWSHVRGQHHPLLSEPLGVQAARPMMDVAAEDRTPTSDTHLQPSLSSEALERLKHPPLELYCAICVGNLDSPAPCSPMTSNHSHLIGVTTSVKLQIFVATLFRSKPLLDTPDASPTKQTENEKEWHIFVLPYEAIWSSLKSKQLSSVSGSRTAEPSAAAYASSLDILWSPTLERRLIISALPRLQLVHEVTFIATKPGTHTIYIGALDLETNDLLWHNAPIVLTVA